MQEMEERTVIEESSEIRENPGTSESLESSESRGIIQETRGVPGTVEG